MRSYSNIRRSLFSIENASPQLDLAFPSPRPSVVSRNHLRKRLSTTYTPSSSLIANLRTGAPNAALRLRGSELKQTGVVTQCRTHHYSTAREIDEPHEVLEKQSSSTYVSEIQPESDEAILHAARSDTDSLEIGDGVFPDEKDYNGLGLLLRAWPKETVLAEFVDKGHMKLEQNFSETKDQNFSQTKDQIHHCHLECEIPETGEIVKTSRSNRKKAVAEHKAFLSMISKLHVGGVLQNLDDLRSKSDNLQLVLEDDQIVFMRRALGDLRRASKFAVAESHRRQAQMPEVKQPPSQRTQIPEETDKIRSMNLTQWLRKYRQSPDLAHIRDRLEQLPIRQNTKQILDLVSSNTYSIIQADTGSGKSTQIPQIILNQAIEAGEALGCRIVCCQPRRMAAVSLARQVSLERSDQKNRSTVGYRIRFDHQIPEKGGSITYCTYGILLQMLSNSSSALDSYTHIVLDEVHERDIQLDYVMLLLKDCIEKRQATGAFIPKVIVTSATIDADRFANYFQNKSSDGKLTPAPRIAIPGRTFEVQKYYLDSTVASLSQVYSQETLQRLFQEPQTESYLERYGLYPKEVTCDSEDKVDPQEQEDAGRDLLGSTSGIMHEEDPIFPWDLICTVIGYILSTRKEGSIMVFLPGLRHIITVEEILRSKGHLLGFDFSDETQFKILQLHSALPEGQMDLLRSAPPNCRRIILTTDISETSVTVPDVKFVVDSGKSHQKLFDPKTGASRLACCWISKSSASQRAGRAGRVQSGEYFALFTKKTHDSLRTDRVPEIVRSDLQGACLRAKKVSTIPAQEFLQKCIDPPSESRVEQAVKNLKMLQALDEQENITSLGEALSDLPLSPSLGKLVLLGIIFRCLDPLLIIACVEGDSSLFHRPRTPEDGREATSIRRGYSRNTWSDHIGVINAFRSVRGVLNRKGKYAAFRFAMAQHINYTRFRDAMLAAEQVTQILRTKGLLPTQPSADKYHFGGREFNVNSWRDPLIKALLLHTSYPNLTIRLPASSRFDLKSSRMFKLYRTERDARTLITSMSVNYPSSPRSLLFFSEKHEKQIPPEGLLMTMHNTSHATPLTACLLAGRLQGSGGKLQLDSWLNFDVRVPGKTFDNEQATKLLIELRKTLNMALAGAYSTLDTRKHVRNVHGAGRLDNQARGLLFDALANNLIGIFDRDVDPSYSNQRLEAPTQWAGIYDPVVD